MKTILCKCGRDILLDDFNYDKVLTFRLNCTQTAVNVDCRPEGGFINLARYLIHVPDGLEPDHKDRNTHNMQVDNLRALTHAQNCLNRDSGRNTSGYRGVSWRAAAKRPWQANIKPPGCPIKYLGSFRTKEEAALAYNQAAIEFFGELATLNKVEDLCLNMVT